MQSDDILDVPYFIQGVFKAIKGWFSKFGLCFQKFGRITGDSNFKMVIIEAAEADISLLLVT